MAFKLNKNDYKLLETVADCRILTPTQPAILLQKGKQVVRRRLRVLQGEGLISNSRSALGHSHRRPEQLLGLTESGVDVLKEKNILARISKIWSK